MWKSIFSIQKSIKFLSFLEWNIGGIYTTNTFVYDYKGIEFSLVKIKDYGYNFEAEMLTTETEVENARKYIKQKFNELGLVPFTQEELNQQCNIINNRSDFQYDFRKQNITTFKRRFPEFFLKRKL